jgi:putative membrane protein
MPSDRLVEDQPRRLHPLSLLFGIAVLVRRFLVPALLFLFLARGDDWQRWMLLPFVFLLGAELIRYFTLTYRVTSDGELVIRSGLFSRTERHIPFERVQNIELVESAVHRVLGVAEVRLQTGSGAEIEAHLRVISRDAVEELRRAMLSTRRAADAAAPASTVLLRLPLSEVALHGLITGRGLVLLAAIVGVLFEYNVDWESFLERFIPGGPEQWQMPWDEAVERWSRTLFLWTMIFVPAAVALRLLSAAWAVVRLYDFTLARTGEGLQSQYGLLTRVSATIPRARVQVLSVHESVWHRCVRRAAVRVDTAGQFKQESGRIGSQWLAPIVKLDRLLPLIREVQPDAEIEPISWTPVHRRAFTRVARLQLLWTLAVAFVLGMNVGPLVLVPAGVVAGLAVWHARRLTGRLAVALTPSSIVLRSGAFNHRRSIARFSRIQSVSYTRSPFDRRWGMSRISVDTAGGSALHRVEMPYLDDAAAREIYRRLRAEVAGAVRGHERPEIRDRSGGDGGPS